MQGRPPFMPPGFGGPPFMPPGGPMGMMMGPGPGGFGPRPMGGMMGPPGMMGMGHGPPGGMMGGHGPPGGRIMTPNQPPPATTAGLIAGFKRGNAAAAAERHFAGGQAPTEKSTMVSVGKIAPSIDSKTIQTLLEACGPLKSWKRAEDPETHVPKGFGFAEYEDAEGVLRAVRLLNGLKVDNQELVIKGNSATQRYVEEYEANKRQERQRAANARMEAAKKKQEEGEVVDEKSLAENAVSGLGKEEQEGDNKALEIIMGIVSEREEEAARRLGANAPSTSAAAATTEFLAQVARGDVKLPPPPARDDSADTPAGPDRGRDRERDKDRDKDRDRDRDRDRERDRATDKERERERERDLERDRRREAEREFELRQREWDKIERQRFEMRERERLRLEQGEKERLRQCRADMEVPDEDDDLPPWARRPYRGSRRCAERKRRRIAEEETDALDKQREQRELEAALTERKRRRQSGEDEDEQSEAAEGTQRMSSRRSGSALNKHMREDGSEVKAEPSEASAAARPVSPEVDEADPIYKAMMAAATSAPRTATSGAHPAGAAAPVAGSYGASAGGGGGLPSVGVGRPGDRAYHHATHDPHAAIKHEHRNVLRSESPQPSVAASTAAPAAPRYQPQPVAAAPAPAAALVPAAGRRVFGGASRGLTNMFGDEEEEGASKRVLKPIQYSEEEKRVADEIDRERRAAATASITPPPTATPPSGDTKAALRALMDSIPTNKDGVWAYSIKWGQVNGAMKQRFSQWVDSKVAQLLGAPEQSVVSYILDLISQNKGPADAATELEPLLDQDTETFVIKMYRTLIFETERAAMGI